MNENLPAYLQDETVQKKSRRQEEKSAKDYGGRRIGGSGSGRTKGDINKSINICGMKGFKGELKYTDAESYRLQLKDLRKIEAQAFSEDKFPFFEIQIQGVTWVAFRKSEAKMFMDQVTEI